MKIFIDVDNTMIEHHGFYNFQTESRVHKSIGKYPLDNKVSIDSMYQTSICRDPEIIRELFNNDNVHILTKYPNMEYEELKRKRVAEILQMSVDEMMSLKNLDGKCKYIAVKMEESKVDKVLEELEVDSIEGYILIDDYSQNIIEWEIEGGIGIKFYNEYNSKDHPTNGISISNYEIFKCYLRKEEIKNLIIVGNNRYKIDMLTNELNRDVQEIDFVFFIYDIIKERYGASHYLENNKYSIKNFLIEYYKFLNQINPGFWEEKLSELINEDDSLILTSLFEPNLDRMMKIDKLQKHHTLTMNFISSEENHNENVYDLYITIADKRNIMHVTDTFCYIANILKELIKGEA